MLLNLNFPKNLEKCCLECRVQEFTKSLREMESFLPELGSSNFSEKLDPRISPRNWIHKFLREIGSSNFSEKFRENYVVKFLQEKIFYDISPRNLVTWFSRNFSEKFEDPISRRNLMIQFLAEIWWSNFSEKFDNTTYTTFFRTKKSYQKRGFSSTFSRKLKKPSIFWSCFLMILL